MEGNERKHIEERLKLLRNVNTMINASIAMMNQYQMIVANLPPMPIPSTSSAAAASNVESAEVKTESSEKVKLEDLGSEDFLDQVQQQSDDQPSSSSKASNSSPFVSSEFAATTSSGESEEANEIRKRRLQKFVRADN